MTLHFEVDGRARRAAVWMPPDAARHERWPLVVFLHAYEERGDDQEHLAVGIGPALEEIASEMGDEVTIVKVNIDENPNAPSQYGVRGIPTLLLFKDGAVADKKVGADSKTGISSWIKSAL